MSFCVSLLCLSMGTTEPLVSEVEGMSLVAREVVAKAKYSGRVIINAILGRQDGGIALIGQKVIVGGWVKTGRVVGRSTSAFLELNDGSCSANLQVIYAYFSSVFLVPSLIHSALLMTFFLLGRFVPSGRHDLGF